MRGLLLCLLLGLLGCGPTVTPAAKWLIKVQDLQGNTVREIYASYAVITKAGRLTYRDSTGQHILIGVPLEITRISSGAVLRSTLKEVR